jgi:hypothetical protein
MKKTYHIPVSWQMSGVYHIEAESLQQALQIAEDSNLPEDSDFIDGSYEVNEEMIPFYNSKDK